TYGLVAGCVIGGPLGTLLMRRNGLHASGLARGASVAAAATAVDAADAANDSTARLPLPAPRGNNDTVMYASILIAISIGAGTLLGPSVHVYAATHPMDAAVRRSGLEAGREVEIGEDCWIGGGAIICPGAKIGDRCVIGAGSVVTRDVPADSFAAGNPCRVIRKITPQDSDDRNAAVLAAG
ncbi:MAG: hypothetical protein EOO25_12280, partial [Comamonadaceae bacterium]